MITGVAKCCAFIFCRNIKKKDCKGLVSVSNYNACLWTMIRLLQSRATTSSACYLLGHVRFTICHGEGVSGAATPETSPYPLRQGCRWFVHDRDVPLCWRSKRAASFICFLSLAALVGERRNKSAISNTMIIYYQ